MLNDLKISFIGAGAMATAIMSGLIRKGLPPGKLSFYDISPVSADKCKSVTGVEPSASPDDAVKSSDIVIIAVKPQHFENAVSMIRNSLGSKLMLSIAAGVKIEKISKLTGSRRIIRSMPNTPAFAGEGISAICGQEGSDPADIETAKLIFEAVGKVCRVDEKMMDAVTALSGSGPAYVFEFIQALTDAGVNCGLARDVSLKLASQTVFGSAKLLMETGEHPVVLRERVPSPGGTTAKGLSVLEMRGFRGTISEAVSAAAARARELGKDRDEN